MQSTFTAYIYHLLHINLTLRGLGDGEGEGGVRGGGGWGQGVVVLQLCSLLSAVVQLFSLVI